MRRIGLMIAATCGVAWFAAAASAEERSPFRLLETAKVADGAATSVDVTPVRNGYGYGWRGYGYYPGYYRPYYGGYQGYYRPYHGGYYGGYYGSYYRPYYNYYAWPYYYGGYYRPYWGGYYYRPYWGSYYGWGWY